MISMLPLILLANPMPNTDNFASVYNFKSNATIIVDETCFNYVDYSINFTFHFYGTFYFNSVDSWEFWCSDIDSYLYATDIAYNTKEMFFSNSLEDLNDFDYPIFTFSDHNFNEEDSFNIVAITTTKNVDNVNYFNVGITMTTIQNRLIFEGTTPFQGLAFPTGYRARADFSFDSTNSSYVNSAFSTAVSNARALVDTNDNFMYNYGYENGKANGDYNGHLRGLQEGYNNGRRDGYIEGYNEAYQEDSTATAIFDGILTIGLIPVDFFLSIFNFEILGINITQFITSMLTLMLVLIMMRSIFNGGSSNG